MKRTKKGKGGMGPEFLLISDYTEYRVESLEVDVTPSCEREVVLNRFVSFRSIFLSNVRGGKQILGSTL